MRKLGLLQPLGGGADLDGGKAVIEVELLGEHDAQRLIVIDQQNFLAAIVYRHAAAYLSAPYIHSLYPVRSGGKSGSHRQSAPDMLKTSPMTAGQLLSRTATALAAVERAMAELRRGGIVVLRDDDGAGGLVIAAEACGPARPAAPAGPRPGRAGAGHHAAARRGHRHGDPAPYRGRAGRDQQADHARPARGGAGRHHPAAARGQPGNRPPRRAAPPVAAGGEPCAAHRPDRHRAGQARPPAAGGGAGAAQPRSRQQAARLGARAGSGLRRCGGCAGLRGHRLAQPPAGGAGARAAGGRGECPHPRLAAERRRQGASRHRGGRDRSDRTGADPAPFRMLHRRPSGLAALRLRRAAARRHRRDRQAGFGRAALSRPGRPRHRPGEQAAGPTSCRTTASTRSTPTSSWASTPTSASTRRPPPCWRAWASSACG